MAHSSGISSGAAAKIVHCEKMRELIDVKVCMVLTSMDPAR
jgi:hypothetical protein